jgi:nucleoid DNA-binding protein
MLINDLSRNAGCSPEVASNYAATVVKWVVRQIVEEGRLLVSDFGEFRIKKHLEFIYFDTATKKRWLVPPSLQLLFTPMPLIDKEERENSKAFSRMAEAIVKEHGENQLSAHKFAVMFFKTILDAMEETPSVEVEGLGVFALAQMRVADAIYGKVAFTPDSTLLADINKPFAFFQPVELNEGVSFPGIETSTHRFPEEKDNKTFLIFQEKQEPETPAAPFSVGGGSAAAEEPSPSSEPSPSAPSEPSPSAPSEPAPSVPSELAPPSSPFSAGGGSAAAEEPFPLEEPAPAPSRRFLRYLLPALFLAACVLFFFILRPAEPASPISEPAPSAPSEPAPSVSSEQAPSSSQFSAGGGSAAAEPASEPSSEAPAAPLLDFAAMNAQLPYGGYDIVGVASTITVPSGMTLQKIARTYLGTDYTEYLVVLNGGNADPQPGQKYMIPKLQLRKARR